MTNTVDLTLARVNRIDDRLEGVSNHLDRVENSLSASIATVDTHVGALTAEVYRLNERFDRLEMLLKER